MKLRTAFEVLRGDVVAFTGAGGKTSAMVGLGYELVEIGWRVLATCTVPVASEVLSVIPYHMPFSAGADAISQALTDHGFVFVYNYEQNGRLYGGSVNWATQLLDSIDSDVLLVEADISQGQPFKAPFPDEPLIPQEASLVVPVASLAVLDKPLNEEHVYNAAAMTDRYGFYPNSPVRSPWVAQVMRDDTLGLRNIPERARVVGFLNQTPEAGYLRTRSRLIARLMLRNPRLRSVALGSVRAAEPVVEVQRAIGAVVLAGGRSQRMGQPKVLLPWTKGRTIIEHIVEQLIRARIDQIVVVTGAYSDEVKRLVKPMGVSVVHNRAYRTGEMLSSLKAGLRSMSDHISGTLMVLGDQPRIQPRVIYQVLQNYAEGAGDIIIPSYQRQRGHPILLSRRLWPEILDLRGNATPREVINAHADAIGYVNVDTDSVLRDVDTPEDYHQERLRAGLRRMDLTGED